MHRPLNEEVLQSAADAAKDEVVDVSAKVNAAEHSYGKSPRSKFASGFYQRVEDRATRFVLLKPMKASIMAASAGALLALLLEHSLKKWIHNAH